MKAKGTFHKIIRTLFLSFGICLTLVACRDNTKNGAVVFSFDDQYIDEWYSQRELFNKYDVRATFFINRPQNLKPDQIEKLLLLQKDGHEIGCHGLNHLNVVEYKDSLEYLLKTEVNPAIELLTEMGFDIVSYAYPFGKSTVPIDTFFLNHFQYVRKATWNNKDTTLDYYDDIFAGKNNFSATNSMGIDYNYNITPENFETGLLRAKGKNEALILHAHKIDTTLTNYSIHPQYLENTFVLCKKHNIKPIRICDLEDYLNTTNVN